MRALFTLADISGWTLIHWLTRQPPSLPSHHHPNASSRSLHPLPLSCQTPTHINMKVQKNLYANISSSSCFLLPWTSCFTHMAIPAGTHTHEKTHTHTHTQYPELEMHGGRLLRRGKPSVNDSSCGKIMFLMQRRPRRWWRKMTFWMVKWVNVRSWPQRSRSPHPPSIPPLSPLLSPSLCLPLSSPSTRLFIEKARGGSR